MDQTVRYFVAHIAGPEMGYFWRRMRKRLNSRPELYTWAGSFREIEEKLVSREYQLWIAGVEDDVVFYALGYRYVDFEGLMNYSIASLVGEKGSIELLKSVIGDWELGIRKCMGVKRISLAGRIGLEKVLGDIGYRKSSVVMTKSFEEMVH